MSHPNNWVSNSRWTPDQIDDQSGRVAMITGANSGIGYRVALHMAEHGARTVLACRDTAEGARAAQRIADAVPDAATRVEEVDLADLCSVEHLAGRIAERGDRLDYLFNNAGVMMASNEKTAQGHEFHFGVNHLAHFVLTNRLLPTLMATPDSVIVTVSSYGHRWGGIDFDALGARSGPGNASKAYAQSKLANLLFHYELDRRLTNARAPTRAVAAHPGRARTELARHSRMLRLVQPLLSQSADQGSWPLLYAATSPRAAAGKYYGPNGFLGLTGYPAESTASPRARDPGAAGRLWDLSESLTGVTSGI